MWTVQYTTDRNECKVYKRFRFLPTEFLSYPEPSSKLGTCLLAMENAKLLVRHIIEYFPLSYGHTIVVSSSTSRESVSFLDCFLTSLTCSNRLGIRAVTLQDCRFDSKKIPESISLLQTLSRVARHGSLHTLTMSGQLIDDFTNLDSYEFFRVATAAIASFRHVNLTNLVMPQRHYGFILCALATSILVESVHITNAKIIASDELRADIKASSGAFGLNNPLFLHEIAARLREHIPTDVWSSGWVFQEAQRMVMYVVQNSFVTTVPASVGVNLFVCACAFVLGCSDDVCWWEEAGMKSVLCKSVEKCAGVADPVTNLIMGVVHTDAGFLPGAIQSTFGFSSIPERYSEFHKYTLEACVMKRIDPRSISEARTWLDVATLPFLFANLVRGKSVTSADVLDELFTWALDVL